MSKKERYRYLATQRVLSRWSEGAWFHSWMLHSETRQQVGTQRPPMDNIYESSPPLVKVNQYGYSEQAWNRNWTRRYFLCLFILIYSTIDSSLCVKVRPRPSAAFSQPRELKYMKKPSWIIIICIILTAFCFINRGCLHAHRLCIKKKYCALKRQWITVFAGTIEICSWMSLLGTILVTSIVVWSLMAHEMMAKIRQSILY